MFAVAQAAAQAALVRPTYNPHQLARGVARQLRLTTAADRHSVDVAVAAVVAFEALYTDHLAGIAARSLVPPRSTGPPPTWDEFVLRGRRPPVFTPTLEWEAPDPVPAASTPVVISDDPESSTDQMSDVEP
jgi:hypothetical protein